MVVVVVVVGKRLGSLVGTAVELAAGVALVGHRRIDRLKHMSFGIEQLAVAEKHSSVRRSFDNLEHIVAVDIAERIRRLMVVEIGRMSKTVGQSWFGMVDSCRMGQLEWHIHKRIDGERGGTHHQPPRRLKQPKVQE